MRFVKDFIESFTTITTAIVIVCALTIWLGDSGIPNTFLRDLLIASAVTSLVTTLIMGHEYQTWRTYLIATCIHFAVMSVIMIVCGIQFGWIPADIQGAIMMIVEVAIVYVLVVVFLYVLDKKDADTMNQALKERNRQ